jgi:protein tyrosine phosphatase (PTP) superfamily phosphohydrolase (DUF442 family)
VNQLSTTIPRFHTYNPHLASGAQPRPEHFAELKAQGFEAVVNLSPASTRNALADEAALVEGQGLDYVHFPIDCSRLRPTHYLTFAGILNGLSGKKVFVHRGGNIKSSNLVHMYHVLHEGQKEGRSLAVLRTLQDPEEKWFTYFRSMGMKGLTSQE